MIKSENGSAKCVVLTANPNDHVFYVNADNGFTVTGATGYTAGIYLYNSNNCGTENVNASNNYYGIYPRFSSNIIAKNTASNNYDGIRLTSSSNNII